MIGIAVFTVIWLAPIVLVVFSSLKTTKETYGRTGLISIPHSLDFTNYSNAWSIGDLSTYMRNSVLITAIKVPIGIIVEALLAYWLAFGRTRLRSLVFLVVVVGMVIPPQSVLVPLRSVLDAGHLSNSWLGLILIYVGFGVPFGTILLRGNFRTIPMELLEAAEIDGAGHARKLLQIALPIALPGIASLAIFDTVWTWNEFLFAQLFITSESKRPVQAGLLAFSGQHTQDFGLLSAGVVISVVPVIVGFCFFQKRFVAGLSGALKG
jgi:raffinose/stachyose/melibiose transport system permease protein